MAITGKNYIGNKLSSLGSIQFKTFNPITNQENDQLFFEATEKEINQAAEMAQEAFLQYRNTTGEDKSIFLHRIADEILDLGQELIDVYCSETGLPEKRVLIERTRTINQLRDFADLVKEGSWVDAHIETAIPDRKPLPKPDLRKMLIPLGPVVVFGASNFPLAYSTAGGDTAAALASGCPVIVKSHPMHAGTGELVASAIIKAAQKSNMPNGVFSNINSSGIEVGKKLVTHPLVKAIGFTGSINGGRAIYNLAAQRQEPIPVFAEMGSINPTIILPKAMENRGQSIAKTYAFAITMGTGQFCTNPGLILGIKSNALDQFTQELADAIISKQPRCMLHPNIIGSYEKNRNKAKNETGVELVTEYSKTTPENHARQTILTVDGKTFINNKNLHHEVFGPFSLVVQCEDLQELENIISNLEGQLTGTIHGDEDEIVHYQSLVKTLESRVGRIIFNGISNGVEVCPTMHHGGPYPASTDSRFTAVGVHSIKRWVRPVTYQNWPDNILPLELQDDNPLGIKRYTNGELGTL